MIQIERKVQAKEGVLHATFVASCVPLAYGSLDVILSLLLNPWAARPQDNLEEIILPALV